MSSKILERLGGTSSNNNLFRNDQIDHQAVRKTPSSKDFSLDERRVEISQVSQSEKEPNIVHGRFHQRQIKDKRS